MEKSAEYESSLDSRLSEEGDLLMKKYLSSANG